jgi:hypothetical protein
MNVSVRMRAVSLALLALTVAGPAAAQTSVDVGVMLGLYMPAGMYNTDVVCACPPYSAPQLTSASIGGQVRFWLNPRLGLQFTAATTNPYAFGGENMPSGSATPLLVARARSASVQALFGLGANDNVVRAWLGLGAGVIQHYGQAYQPFSNPTSFAGAGTLGGSVRLGGGLNLDAGVSGLIYGMPLYWSGINLSHGTQFDIQFTTGLSWHFE